MDRLRIMLFAIKYYRYSIYNIVKLALSSFLSQYNSEWYRAIFIRQQTDMITV